MLTYTIQLNSIQDVNRFVSLMVKNGLEGYISKIEHERMCADAQSIMGILTFRLRSPLALHITKQKNGVDPEAVLSEFIRKGESI